MKVTLQLGLPNKTFTETSKGSSITDLDRNRELIKEDRDFLHSYFIKYHSSSEWGKWLQEQYNVKID